MRKNAHIAGDMVLGVPLGLMLWPIAATLGGVDGAVLCGVPYYIGVMKGALLPDIDIVESMAGRKHPEIAEKVNKKYGHRGATHSLVFALLPLLIGCLVGIPMFMLAETLRLGWFTIIACVVIALGVGYSVGILSHLLIDTTNKKGVPYLYPYKKKRYSIASWQSNGIAEKRLTRFCILLTLVVLGPQRILAILTAIGFYYAYIANSSRYDYDDDYDYDGY